MAHTRARGAAAPDGGAVTAVGMFVIHTGSRALAAAEHGVGGVGGVTGDDAVDAGVQADVVQLIGRVVHIAGHAVQA